MTLAVTDASTESRLRASGLLPAEYERIVRRLERQPNALELAMLGAMWSEHCGYKHSRRLLRRLPTTGPRVLQGPGENAGAVAIGDGLAVVLKMESHNHPSAVEPLQGAATGVGGILRDVFTMGARPVALLDSLRFGDPTDRRTAYLVDGVIAGIAFYGNCVGIPTVGGEISFDPGYAGNPIVNAMCVGIVSVDRLTRAGASQAGSPLLLVGADTGRDGIQGAAFASNDDPEASHRGVVQVGNPFLEKLLLEACSQVIDTGRVLAMQDLGAAGLTSSSIEMAARGGMGVEIDVARVPRRETGMTPFDVMLSESQERMLVLVRPDDVEDVQRHFARWDLHAEVVGQVTDDARVRIRDGHTVVADLPVPLLTDDVPAYELTVQPPPPYVPPAVNRARQPEPLENTLKRLLASPNLCSRRYAFRQYDSTVQANTVFGPGKGAAAVLRVDGTRRGIALTTDCNPRYTRLDPRRGAEQAVAEAARNLACVGALPIAVTDCLNFGNPEKPAAAWQLTEAVAGLADACRALDVPVVSGNVSLYNETAGRAIPPTPAIGMVGLLEDVTQAIGLAFRQPGDLVLMLGRVPTRVSAGEYLRDGPFPHLDLAEERRLGDLLRSLATKNLLESAQDVSNGGLLIALLESCFADDAGHGLDLESARRDDAFLFSEDQGRAVISLSPSHLHEVEALAHQQEVPLTHLGHVHAEPHLSAFGELIDLAELRHSWENAFEHLLKGAV
jgi:phosphoribosylformylglycinamidine synthase subunit PurL